MNHLAHAELIGIHHAELRAAADHHRLVTSVRGVTRPRPPAVAQLAAWLTGPVPGRRRVIVEPEPCPP